MIKNIKKLIVKYNQKIVGYLVELETGEIAFQYDEEWLKNGFSISPFSLPLTAEVFINPSRNFSGLYGVFHDSLPDGWGEMLVKRALAKRGINYDRLSPLTKLTLVSGNGLGGLAYEPSQNDKVDLGDYNLDEIAEEVKKLLDDGDAHTVDLDAMMQLGGSSGGARPKAHIKDKTDYWIVKFPCRIDPVDIGEKEFEANKAAKLCGIEVNEFKLFSSSVGKGYFGAKRFDRIGEKRVHMISLSSLLETTHRIPNLDYLHLFQVIQNICIDKADIYEAYRRMCFNVIYGNKDDHGKNIAFLYDEERGGYKLSPAYDITQTPFKAEHEMTVNGKGNPDETDLLHVAEILKLSLEKCNAILATVQQALL